MSSPFSSVQDASYQDANGNFNTFDDTDDGSSDIPRRVMRVKVLYTFDTDNKTHCLARLVKPVPIQVVALDENTEIGVVELRTCIQAIVAASPEMVAKLENDYNLYAYDYSEYETPLVGQGLLSWVLATASPTPNAPAKESASLVTGRVCKNIMGLFAAGGIKETLEVKLKLVPVPTRSKREFLQSMAIYRDPNVVMPDGFDQNAWNSFLQAIPDAGVLRDGSAGTTGGSRANVGGVEQLHDLLTPKYGPEDDMFSNGPGSSRAGSPTPSHRSMGGQAPTFSGTRPASRTAFHQSQPSESAVDDQGFEDGPAKKRARLMQTDWRGRGSFGGNADSLRSAVTTAASIRNFRPSAIGNSSAGGDMVPRAPTPRPGEKRMARPGMPRGASNLRRESMSGQSTHSPSEHDLFRNDSGIYSADYDAASSRHGSPSPDLPSSPPEYTPIDPPSSPLPEDSLGLDSGFQSDAPGPYGVRQPTVKRINNVHLQRQREGRIEWAQMAPGPQENLPRHSFPYLDPLSQKAAVAASARRPTSPPLGVIAPPKGGRAASVPMREPSQPRQPSAAPLPTDEPSPNMHHPVPSIENSLPPTPAETPSFNLPPPIYTPPEHYLQQHEQRPPSATTGSKRPIPPFTTQTSAPLPLPPNRQQQNASPGPASQHYVVQKKVRGPLKRTLKKAQSWAAGAESSDVESDGGLRPIGAANNSLRSKGATVRANSIHNQLEADVANGVAPRFCVNCGEIKTPTWRPYWLKVFPGSGEDVPIGLGTGTHLVEPFELDADGKVTRHRVYKQLSHLTPDEKQDGSYQQAYFCNPCGDYIRKWHKIRPRELWDPDMVEKNPKKCGRNKKKRKGPVDALTSDLPMPSSEWDMPTPFGEVPPFTDPFVPSEAGWDMQQSEMGQGFGGQMFPSQQNEPMKASEMVQIALDNLPETQQRGTENRAQGRTRQVPLNNAVEFQDRSQQLSALQKAIQSSPARILHATPIQQQPLDAADDVPQSVEATAEGEVSTPKPTRRLLFPSPRKDGEFKSLETSQSSTVTETNNPKGNSQLSNNSHMEAQQTPHQEQPQHRQTSATPGQHQKKRTQPSENSSSERTTMPSLNLEVEGEVDKENMPPAINEEDEFAHLFVEGIFATPGKASSRTPTKAVPRTPNSKTRNLFSTGLTPRTGSKRSADCMGPPDTPTPTKRRSPRLAEKIAHGAKEMTPFTKSLNLFLSDGLTSSPSKAFNWTLTSSPAKNLSTTFGDMAAISKISASVQYKAGAVAMSDDNLWSEFPLPSSPPFFRENRKARGMAEDFSDYDWQGLDMNLGSTIEVDVWEDGTATQGLGSEWDGVFDAPAAAEGTSQAPVTVTQAEG